MIDFLQTTILLERREATRHLARAWAELFELLHKANRLVAKSERWYETRVMSLEVGCWDLVPREIPIVLTAETFDQGFLCCDMIFLSYYVEIRLATDLFIPANASIEQMVRIIKTRRVRLVKALHSSYVYFL